MRYASFDDDERRRVDHIEELAQTVRLLIVLGMIVIGFFIAVHVAGSFDRAACAEAREVCEAER